MSFSVTPFGVVKASRCWEGYEPVPGKKPYSKDSCRPKGTKTKVKTKAAGYISEYASMLNPLNTVAHLPAALVAALTRTRTAHDQAKADDAVLSNLLIPGVGPYNQWKRYGYSIRNRDLLKARDHRNYPEYQTSQEKKATVVQPTRQAVRDYLLNWNRAGAFDTDNYEDLEENLPWAPNAWKQTADNDPAETFQLDTNQLARRFLLNRSRERAVNNYIDKHFAHLPAEQVSKKANELKRLQLLLTKQAGLFYRDLDKPSPFVVEDDPFLVDDVSTEGLATIQTQTPRLLTRLFSSPEKDVQKALQQVRKQNPNAFTPSKNPAEHLSNLLGKSLQQAYPSRYRNPTQSELIQTLLKRLPDEEPANAREYAAVKRRFSPMTAQHYSTPDEQAEMRHILEILTGAPRMTSGAGRKKQAAVNKLQLLLTKRAEGGAWTRAEGKSESGGLNAKGRASLKAQGQNIKPPVTESNPTGERKDRKSSFCARMGGMKKKLTSSETANDPDSRINKALRKWKC